MLFALPRGFSYLKLNKPWLVLVRGAIAVVTYYLYFISKTWIDIVDNSILFSSDAILIPVILFLFLNVKINYLQWIGILIGFCGIGFVYSFDLKLHTLHGFIAGLIGLSSGIGLAVIIVLQSYMVKNDPPLRIALYQSIIGLFSAGMIAYFNWQTPTFSDSLYMIFGGIFFAVALFLFLDSFYYTETYVIGVLNYSIVLFVEGLNWIINKEPINLKTIIGSLIIILGGMITIMVTYHLDKKRSKIS
jgi:drug/metabolite transporter (DMT)-like permease